MEPRLILIQLLLKLGVAAAVSSSIVRSLEFKSLLFREGPDETHFGSDVETATCSMIDTLNIIATDASTAPDSLGRLVVRRGPDAFVIGTEIGPGAVDAATLVGKAVLAASTQGVRRSQCETG